MGCRLSTVVNLELHFYLGSSKVDALYFSSSDESSWKRATELLVEVASHGENTGYGVPCLIVAAKDDLDPYPMAIHDATRVFTSTSRSVIISFALCYSPGCQFGLKLLITLRQYD